jgi:cytochrome c-type biogenesis protein CcmH/NrfG
MYTPLYKGDLVAAEGAHQEALQIDPLNIKTLTLFAVFLHRKKGRHIY